MTAGSAVGGWVAGVRSAAGVRVNGVRSADVRAPVSGAGMSRAMRPGTGRRRTAAGEVRTSGTT